MYWSKHTHGKKWQSGMGWGWEKERKKNIPIGPLEVTCVWCGLKGHEDMLGGRTVKYQTNILLQKLSQKESFFNERNLYV